MDSDQHRQKRFRIGSWDRENISRSRNDVSNDEAKQTNPDQPSQLVSATKALKNCSLQDTGDPNINGTSHPPHQTYQPSPPASFLSHPSFQQNGAPNANFHFDPVVDQHKGNNHAPATSTCHPAGNLDQPLPQGSDHLSKQLIQRVHGSQPTTLPLHGPRHIQPLGGPRAGPYGKQVERDANTEPNELSRTTDQKRSRPRPIYVPSAEGRMLSKPVPHPDDTSRDSSTSGHFVEQPQKQIPPSHMNPCDSELSRDEIRAATECPYQAMTRKNAAASFPYLSVYPANERRFDGKWVSKADCPPSPPSCPPNHYMSPNRVPNAALVASRKRKRGWPALPPPAYIYTRTNDPYFNIFGGILLYPELCFALAANLPVNDLLSLYAISKDFHTIIDARFATVILSQSVRKCPESSQVFPFRCYRYLCRPDPAPRIPHPHPVKQAAGEIRHVPSFKWLKMVLFREKVCHEIMTMMAEDGIPVPSRCELALKKMWFLMDIPDNARRIGYVHLHKLMTDLDLYFMMCFIVKLDLRFNDPVAPNRYHGLRKIMLAQRGLLPLWRTLKRSTLLTRQDVLKLWVVTKHNPAPEEEGLPMFGVPGDDIGKMRMEYWGERSTHDTGKACTFLLRPDQLLMREIIRRKMVFSKHFLRCLLWGYVDIVTMENYPPRNWNRRIKDLDEEYEDDDECAGFEPASGAKDDLLDLGVKKPISMLVSLEGRDQEKSMQMKKQDAFLEECMKWYKEESQRTGGEAEVSI